MTKVVKSISLDEQTSILASSKNNFSAWVREQLLAEVAHTIPCSYFSDIHQICNGMRKPHCITCYPEGPPTREDWLAFVSEEITQEELQEKALETWSWRTQLKTEPKNVEDAPQPLGVEREKKYLRRLIWWIWSYI
tara:strand:- start:724 stop:1131 length:408 start_codon:yes stop_codon:yes gene_type:complete